MQDIHRNNYFNLQSEMLLLSSTPVRQEKHAYNIACASATKLYKLSLGPMIYLSRLDPVVYLSLSLKFPEAKQFLWQGLLAWRWVALEITRHARRRWRLLSCVVEVVYEEKHIQPAKAEPNVQSAWLDKLLVAWHSIRVEKPWSLCCTLSHLRGHRLCNVLAASVAEPWAVL